MCENDNCKIYNRLYSIVVPVYGVEKYLEKCIDSLRKQTYGNIEIILVDDGSKDGSAMICEYHAKKDSRITVHHKNNGGLVSARKAGAKIANGDYIVCVDGDDWISKEYIETINKIVLTYEPDVVCCGFVLADDEKNDNKEIFLAEGYYDEKLIKEKIYPIAIESNRGISFPHNLCSKAFKRDIYISEQLSVNDSIRIGEDSVVVKPILTKCKSLYVLKECLYFYRNNVSSMTKCKSTFDWNGPRLMYQHLMERVNVHQDDFYEQIQRRTFRALYAVVISQFNSMDKYRQIKKNIIDNISNDDYKIVLSQCRYVGIKQKIELGIIKYRLIFLLYIIYKIKH